MRSQLELLAADAEQVVIGAGGLICDRALDGWQVVVWMPDAAGSVALKILGAEVRLAGSEVAIAADIKLPLVQITPALDASSGVRQCQTYLCDRSDPGGARVGRPGPQAVADGVFHHRLSFAAQAFKAQALGACGSPAAVEVVEVFRATDMRWSIGPSAGRTVTTQVH